MPRDVDEREMDEFISILAHDLRTPLTSIRGYAQLMLRQRRTANAEQQGSDDDPIGGGLRIIMEQSDRLAGLTDLLLDVSRIRLGRVALRQGQVDLAAVVRATIAGLPGVEFNVASPEAGPLVEGDATRVQQMVEALLRFLAARGGSERVDVRIDANGGEDGLVSLVAEGGGAALGADEVEHLLHRLVRPAATVAQWELAHPELVIARGVAEAHGGALSVISPIDGTERGVRLTLSLPAA